ncbi:hypothetical protein NP493_1480g00007 [Ridgeia piscesae]|uniref:RING-type domain-containing protein n=1 Tax=Ridgeia piscesae TaxID=27915 RepID=A0AAD9K265_RIDPI|nr:hypothetical protein NP493_1480g00007 [Ridgeia piscesae]
MELPAKCVIKDKVLSFYVTPTGSVTYAVCGVEEGTLFSGVDTSRPLWVVIDIYANTSCVEFVESPVVAATPAASGPRRAHVVGPLRSTSSQSADHECAVCMDRSADCVLVPCAHTCLCYTCAVKIHRSDNASCPMCRHVISGVNKTRRPRDQSRRRSVQKQQPDVICHDEGTCRNNSTT